MSLQSDHFSRVGQDIRQLESNKADKHEIYSLSSNMDQLENKTKRIDTEVSELRSRIEMLELTIQTIGHSLASQGIEI